jgi:prephenate dehydrogenase
MRIWVIGADLLARALGRSWGQAGHQVLFTFGDHTDWDALAAETGGRVGTLAEGATAEVVLLAAPWATVGKALRTAGRWRARWCWTRPTRTSPWWVPRGPSRVSAKCGLVWLVMTG